MIAQRVGSQHTACAIIIMAILVSGISLFPACRSVDSRPTGPAASAQEAHSTDLHEAIIQDGDIALRQEYDKAYEALFERLRALSSAITDEKYSSKARDAMREAYEYICILVESDHQSAGNAMGWYLQEFIDEARSREKDLATALSQAEHFTFVYIEDIRIDSSYSTAYDVVVTFGAFVAHFPAQVIVSASPVDEGWQDIECHSSESISTSRRMRIAVAAGPFDDHSNRPRRDPDRLKVQVTVVDRHGITFGATAVATGHVIIDRLFEHTSRHLPSMEPGADVPK